MPNGVDANWIRARAAIEGYYVRYGRWPTRLRLSPGVLEDLRDLFTEQSFRTLEAKIALIPDPDASMIAEDDAGHRYNYGMEGFPSVRPTPDAEAWLGVAPDTPSAHEA